MIARLGDTEQTLDLPPGYTLVALRELGDAFARACEIAAEAGAGTLVWVRRYDLVETIQVFITRLRDQVDLDTLLAELVAVADQTMEPTMISLWLRPPVERPGRSAR